MHRSPWGKQTACILCYPEFSKYDSAPSAEVGIEEDKAPVLRKAGNRVLAKKVQLLLFSTVSMKWGNPSNTSRLQKHSSLWWKIFYTIIIHILYSDLPYEAQNFIFSPPHFTWVGRTLQRNKVADSSQSHPGENRRVVNYLAMIRGITAAFDVTAANVIAIWYTAYFATLKNN